MFEQILPTSTVRNIWRRVRRTYMLILGLNGLNSCPLTEQHLPEVDVRPVKRQRRLKRVSHHDKWNRDVVLRHEETPEGLHEIQRVGHILKHHLMLLSTQYSPLGSQTPEVDIFRCTIKAVLIGPRKTVASV